MVVPRWRQDTEEERAWVGGQKVAIWDTPQLRHLEIPKR